MLVGPTDLNALYFCIWEKGTIGEQQNGGNNRE